MSGKRELKRKLNFCIKKYSYVTEDSIDLSFMPPLSRRKLSLADKLALCAMNECYETPEVKIVFASQYGEIDRLDKIITQYTEEKASNFLYMIVKNHVFVDGNKRIAATLFIYFLNYYNIMVILNVTIISSIWSIITCITIIACWSCYVII